jgi:hypothetical protein
VSGCCKAARLFTDLADIRPEDSGDEASDRPAEQAPFRSAVRCKVDPGWLAVTSIATAIRIPPRPRPCSSIDFGSS